MATGSPQFEANRVRLQRLLDAVGRAMADHQGIPAKQDPLRSGYCVCRMCDILRGGLRPDWYAPPLGELRPEYRSPATEKAGVDDLEATIQQFSGASVCTGCRWPKE